MFERDHNPLQEGKHGDWDRLIEAIGPASILVLIERRLGAKLRRSIAPDDILQESLLRAWRDRTSCEWRGLRSFRSWLLTIVDHCIRDAADYFGAQKRGGGQTPTPFSAMRPMSSGGSEPSVFAGPVVTTTPSRVVADLEQAAAMCSALEALPEELRDVVRLRLFQQLSMHVIASQLGIGLSAARHRFRKGAAAYRERLTQQLASRSIHDLQENAALGSTKSAPGTEET